LATATGDSLPVTNAEASAHEKGGQTWKKSTVPQSHRPRLP
jgi:hypothetical protein